MLLIYNSIIAWTQDGLNLEAIAKDFNIKSRVWDIVIRLEDPFLHNEWKGDSITPSYDDIYNLMAFKQCNIKYYSRIKRIFEARAPQQKNV